MYFPFSSACFGRSSLSITCIPAMAAEQASAPPHVVVVWMKGLGYIIHCQISSVETNADIGITPPPRDFPSVMISGVTHQ